MTPAEFRQLRLAAGLSARQAGAKLGVDPRTIRRWESGDSAKIPSGVADRLRELAAEQYETTVDPSIIDAATASLETP